jgi:hypothetical protein
MTLTEFLGRQNKVVLVSTGFMLFAAVALFDLASGPKFELSIFYLIPVSFFAWFLGRRNGLIASLICAAIGLAIHRAHHFYIRGGIAYWNALA